MPCSISSFSWNRWGDDESQLSRDCVCHSSISVCPSGAVAYSYVFANDLRSAAATDGINNTKATKKYRICEVENNFQFQSLQEPRSKNAQAHDLRWRSSLCGNQYGADGC